jgi:hypothetical protein
MGIMIKYSKMANSFLEPEGLFNPSLRFAFTNISDDDFVSYWDKIAISVKPHETIELSITTPIPGVSGHALAVKMTGELVDKIMIGEAKMDETNNKNALNPYYRSPKGSSLGVPAARKIWEDQILRELAIDEESPAVQSMRKQLKEQILGGAEEKQSIAPVHVPTSIGEFADINKEEAPIIKKPARTKRIKNETLKSSGTEAK